MRSSSPGAPHVRMSHRDRSFGSYDLLVFGIALLGLLDVTHLAVQQQRGFEDGCFGDPSFGAAVRGVPVVQGAAAVQVVSAARSRTAYAFGLGAGTAAGAYAATVAAPPADCGSVVESEAGTFLGLSNIGWGFLFYGTLAFLSLVRGTRTWRRELVGTLRELLVVVGFGYSIFLVYVQLFVLQQICTLCMISAGLVTVLFALTAWTVWMEAARSSDGVSGSLGEEGGRIDPPGWYLTAIVLWLLLATADVLLFGGGFGTLIS